MEHGNMGHRSISDDLDYRWRRKDGEASLGREESLQLLVYIIKNIR